MNLDAIVAVSQLLAAVGVIISLIFVAIQLRQNTNAVRASSIQNLVQSLSANAQSWVENEGLISIALKANSNPEQLSDEELARLHFWFVMAIRRFEGVYFQRSLGLVDSAFIEGFERRACIDNRQQERPRLVEQRKGDIQLRLCFVCRSAVSEPGAQKLVLCIR